MDEKQEQRVYAQDSMSLLELDILLAIFALLVLILACLYWGDAILAWMAHLPRDGDIGKLGGILMRIE